jgi:hypothetical protein
MEANQHTITSHNYSELENLEVPSDRTNFELFCNFSGPNIETIRSIWKHELEYLAFVQCKSRDHTGLLLRWPQCFTS